MAQIAFQGGGHWTPVVHNAPSTDTAAHLGRRESPTRASGPGVAATDGRSSSQCSTIRPDPQTKTAIPGPGRKRGKVLSYTKDGDTWRLARRCASRGAALGEFPVNWDPVQHSGSSSCRIARVRGGGSTAIVSVKKLSMTVGARGVGWMTACPCSLAKGRYGLDGQ